MGFIDFLKEILRPGNGVDYPQKGDMVTVHYHGYLHDPTRSWGRGRRFDSSIKRGYPFTFQIGMGTVIKGWEVGVLGMSLGEKALLTFGPYVSPFLWYGLGVLITGTGIMGTGRRAPRHLSPGMRIWSSRWNCWRLMDGAWIPAVIRSEHGPCRFRRAYDMLAFTVEGRVYCLVYMTMHIRDVHLQKLIIQLHQTRRHHIPRRERAVAIRLTPIRPLRCPRILWGRRRHLCLGLARNLPPHDRFTRRPIVPLWRMARCTDRRATVRCQRHMGLETPRSQRDQ